jgi:hypothetical protein
MMKNNEEAAKEMDSLGDNDSLWIDYNKAIMFANATCYKNSIKYIEIFFEKLE